MPLLLVHAPLWDYQAVCQDCHTGKQLPDDIVLYTIYSWQKSFV